MEFDFPEVLIQRLGPASVSAEAEDELRSLPIRFIKLATRQDFLPSTKGPTCFVLAKGMVARFTQMTSKRRVTAFHVPGDLITIVPRLKMGYTGLTPIGSARLVQLAADGLVECSARHPSIGKAFWREREIQFATLNEWLANDTRDSQIRVAHFLCEMAIRITGSNEPQSFVWPMTQQLFGEALSLTPVHINRTLKALRGRGLAFVAGGVVNIPDWGKLVEFAGFDPSYLQPSFPNVG